jgi:Rhodopirellula transposase DDE domain
MPQNCGGVSVGVDPDTAAFALATVQQWWQRMGCRMDPKAQQLLMTADGGESNGSRSRLWKVELQQFRKATGLEVRVCHFPPGTSKWHTIEHRLCCHITQNWRGRPLVSHEVMVKLIANTTTAAGLHVEAALAPGAYETGNKVSDAALAQVN